MLNIATDILFELNCKFIFYYYYYCTTSLLAALTSCFLNSATVLTPNVRLTPPF